MSLPLSNPDVYIWCSVVSTSEPWFRTRIDVGSHGKDIGAWGHLKVSRGNFIGIEPWKGSYLQQMDGIDNLEEMRKID